MSTHFVGEGNIGSAPDYREFRTATTSRAGCCA